MCTFARYYLGKIGDLEGDIELAIFRNLRICGLRERTLRNGTTVKLVLNGYGGYNILINDYPCNNYSLDFLAGDILSALEEEPYYPSI